MPNSVLILLFTNNQPIEGASACSIDSFLAYSSGIASGIVERICATFIIGPFKFPNSCVNSSAFLSF